MKLQKENIPFTMVANEVLNRADLSLKAKGLFAYLFSKPDGWDFAAERIAKDCLEERKTILSILSELEEKKLLHREKLPSGRVRYTIHYADATDNGTASLFPESEKRTLGTPGYQRGTLVPISNIDIYKNFFEEAQKKSEGYQKKIIGITAKDYLKPREIHRIVLEEFIPYWTERSEGGTKERWQKERVFDPWRRLETWLRNHHQRKRDWRCRETNMWHPAAERCYCKKPEEVKEPTAPMTFQDRQRRLGLDALSMGVVKKFKMPGTA